MRAAGRTAILAAGVMWIALGGAARAEPAVSGAIGAGVVGDRPATVLEAGADFAGPNYALGLGLRLRVLADGLRSEDWDEPSELVGLIRYFVHRRDGARLRLAVVAGELGGVEVGHGALVAGYVAGLDIDHGHTGAQIRAGLGRWGGELLVDDLVAPRIAAGRGTWDHASGARFGAGAAADLRAPTTAGTEVLAALSVDAAIGRGFAEDRVRLTGYAEAAALIGLGAGLHLGGRVELSPLGSATRLQARGEVRLGSDRYLPGWFGPLYEHDRRAARSDRAMGTQLEVVRAGGLGGAGALAEVGAANDEIGRLALSYAQRPGMSRLVTARLEAPAWQVLQLGVWAAAEVEAGHTDAAAFAGELRVRLPRALFGRLEAARLYRDEAGMAVPTWVLTAAVGGVLGE